MNAESPVAALGSTLATHFPKIVESYCSNMFLSSAPDGIISGVKSGSRVFRAFCSLATSSLSVMSMRRKFIICSFFSGRASERVVQAFKIQDSRFKIRDSRFSVVQTLSSRYSFRVASAFVFRSMVMVVVRVRVRVRVRVMIRVRVMVMVMVRDRVMVRAMSQPLCTFPSKLIHGNLTLTLTFV